MSLFAVVVTLALLVVLGLVVDGGGKVAALQRAQAIAREAARAGGEAVLVPQAVRGQGVTIDTAAARSAAQAYLTTSGLDGTITFPSATSISVETTADYTPIFLSIIGIGTQTVHGRAEARLVRTVAGAER